MTLQLLKKLTESFGPSGFEDETREIVRKELEPLCDKVWVNTMGSVVGFKKGKGKDKDRKKIMLAGHIDEIGFIVSHVDEKTGFLRFVTVGGFDPKTLVCQRVLVLGKGKHKLPGLLSIAGKPIHLMTPEESKKGLALTDFYIDLGLSGKEAAKKVEVGDPVVWQRELTEMGDLVNCKAMDDRVGVYVMIEALRKTKGNTHDIYAVGTSQEEVGLRGATTSAYEIMPDVGIALDITLAMDIPGGEPHAQVACLGKGITVGIMNSAVISDRELVKEMRKIAEAKKIPHQLEILPRGGTDAGAMQRTGIGARSITLSIPTRYGHSVNETVSMKDVQAGIDLLAAYLSQ
jgi:tetrahedral aminopeptidase